MEVDRPDVVAEVAEAFAAYERALVANDVEAMNRQFWADDRATRFGIADHQQSGGEIAAWRAQAVPVPPSRELDETRVVTFGDGFAIVTTLFSYPGRPFLGRQTQVWARLAEGWRIVSAHVSEVDL
jgi:ketosteroid isomerase-like protein